MSETGTQQAKRWGRQWLAFMQASGFISGAQDLAQRMSGARVRQLEVRPGSVDATVHLRQQGDCQVTIKVPLLDDAQWETVLDALASQAVYAAHLLAGELPGDIDQAFTRAGVTLLPHDAGMLTHTCSCCQPGDNLCKPLLAVYAAIGDMLNDDPWLLFRLRGRERHQVLRGLGARRERLSSAAGEQVDGGQATVVYRNGETEPASSGAPTLTDQIDQFWGSTRAQMNFSHHIARPMVDIALLRQLGPDPFDDQFDAFDTLAAVYRRVSEAGLAMAFAPEPETDSADREAID